MVVHDIPPQSRWGFAPDPTRGEAPGPHRQAFSFRPPKRARMSVRSDVGVCRSCGVVALARDMVRMAAYAYACRDCASGEAKR